MLIIDTEDKRYNDVLISEHCIENYLMDPSFGFLPYSREAELALHEAGYRLSLWM